ncbi:MAG: hypothetical protein ACXVUL_14825 [Solirubrobacteraceae bacterium]
MYSGTHDEGSVAPPNPHSLEKFAPWAGSKWLARIRSMEPVVGTPELSVAPLASLAKLTFAKNCEMLPAASAVPWSRSRHQAALATALRLSMTDGSGSAVLNATLKKAGGLVAVPAPPGWVASATAWGSRYRPLDASHRPTPIARRTVL